MTGGLGRGTPDEVRAHVRLPGEAAYVPVTRVFLTTLLQTWRAPAQVVDDAALLVTEVAANAVEHGRGDLVLEVEERSDRVRMSVHDDAPVLPRLVHGGEDLEGGRGMWLVQALSLRWGADPDPSGKTVWVELSTASPPG